MIRIIKSLAQIQIIQVTINNIYTKSAKLNNTLNKYTLTMYINIDHLSYYH